MKKRFWRYSKMNNKKYNVKTECPICKNPIIVSYEKFRPFPKSPVTDVKLNIEVGCSHFLLGSIDGYIEMGRELLQMKQNRRIDYQNLENRDHQKRLKELLGDYDPDDEYNPSRF